MTSVRRCRVVLKPGGISSTSRPPPAWRLLKPVSFAEDTAEKPAGRIGFGRLVETAAKANARFLNQHQTSAEDQPIDLHASGAIPFTAEAEAGMDAWINANQQHKFDKSVYALERYGLPAEKIIEIFSGDAKLAAGPNS